MAAGPATQITLKIGEEHFDADVATAVVTRDINLSEPDNTDDIEVIFLESTVLTKEQALLLLATATTLVQEGDWPR